MEDQIKKTGTPDVKMIYQILYQILGEKYGFHITVTKIRKQEEKS